MSVNKKLVQTARELRLKRGLSQNFLVDDAALSTIAQAAIPENAETPIIEIGAGAGFLTHYLVASGHPVTAIEIDDRMIPVLKEAYGQAPNFRLIHQNVLHVDLLSLFPQTGVIVGNIPYHLTGPILFLIAGEMNQPDFPLRQKLENVVLMVQKEVGDRLTARPGASAYSQLTVQVQFWFETQRVLIVPRNAFYPSPAVDSMVVSLRPRQAPPIAVQDLAFFSRLVKEGFVHRRKTLMNSLKMRGVASELQLKAAFAEAGIPTNARAQEMSIPQFGALTDVLLAQR